MFSDLIQPSSFYQYSGMTCLCPLLRVQSEGMIEEESAPKLIQDVGQIYFPVIFGILFIVSWRLSLAPRD